jgi:hypothetical protein
VIDLQEAEDLFHYFDQVLSRYLWDGMALVHKDLTSVRNSSSMLSAAILLYGIREAGFGIHA